MDKIGLEFKSIIAYVIPGYLFLFSLSFYFPVVYKLLGGDKGVPEGSAIIPIVILSIAGGIFVNAFTLTLIRPIIEKTSISRPDYDYSKINNEKLDRFKRIVEENFRYYQAYSNMFTSGLISLFLWIFSSKGINLVVVIFSIGILIILFLASRISLKRTYLNISSLINEENIMKNQDPCIPPPKKPNKPIKP